MNAIASLRPKPVVLVILDGWGHRAERSDNAIALAQMPTWNRLLKTCPHSLIETSGPAVGLPPGQMGNSEVGHMAIGAGRIKLQDLPRINAAIANKAITANAALSAFIATLRTSGGTAHIVGVISPGGVHGHMDHTLALARILDQAGVQVAIHAILDGRDAPPSSGAQFLERFLEELAPLSRTRIVTVCGRFYAMDRDQRWARTEKAYRAMAEGKGDVAEDALCAVRASYDAKITDEFVRPTVIGAFTGMKDGDGLLMANFRSDRVRQILLAFIDPDFSLFERKKIRFAAATGLTEYSRSLTQHMTVMFPAQPTTPTLGEVVSRAGLRQLRIAETEKYAHVTYFFNGGREAPFPSEERILVQSPRVTTYDFRPEMSAPEITAHLVDAIEGRRYDLIIANYANGDMVGHTGNLSAAILAAEAIDASLARLEVAVTNSAGTMLITADHGNVETMKDASGVPHTQHTTNPVPAVLVNGDVHGLKDGTLADIAPTVLDLLGLAVPAEMTGRSLLTIGTQGKMNAFAAAAPQHAELTH